MINKLLFLVGIVLLSAVALTQNSTSTTAPGYTAEGKLKLPEHYREWVYLSTGFDMSYTAGGNPDHHMFDNVFVNPESYRQFKETGTWPDKTMLVLEARGAESRASINQRGNFQGADVMGIEVHIKDEARFPDGKWAFFGFDNGKVGDLFPAGASCYSCHQSHGAVDTTFVQFYPTLMGIAKTKNTLSSAYVKETTEQSKK
jgi:hypothetical protein